MPSLFTSNGGIELPADGEQDGVWGDTVNTNMQIIDRLTNGVGAIALSGTTHTLTTLNGALSDGQYTLIVFGGTPSGTNTVTVAPNDAEKTYLIRNATAQSVIMTQGSGGDVTIPAGAGAIVYADGAGTGAAVADLTATFIPDLSLAGITASAAEINILDGVTATTAELNLLDGVTASTAELNFVAGVTSAIQPQIAAKQATITGAATTVVDTDLAINRVAVTDTNGKLSVSAVTTAELNILDGVTATTAELNILDGVTATAAELNILDGVTATTAELNFVDGVTSPIQTQIDAKYTLVTQTEAVWQAGTSTTESVVSPAKVKAAIDASGYVQPTTVDTVGTYAWLGSPTTSAAMNPGAFFAGSSLRYAGTASTGTFSDNTAAAIGYSTPSTPSGTWRVMGGVNVSGRYNTTLFLRIV